MLLLSTADIPALMGKHRLNVFKKYLYPEIVKPDDNKQRFDFYRNKEVEDLVFLSGLEQTENYPAENRWAFGQADAIFDDDGLIMLVKPLYKGKEITIAHTTEAQALMLLYDKPGCYVSVVNTDTGESERKLIYEDKDLQKRIIRECENFYEEAEAMRHINVDSFVQQYDELKQNIELMEQEKQNILQKIVMICDNKEAVIDGHKLQRVTRKGAVDYKQIEALKDVDLEKYRKKPSEYWVLS